MTAEYILGYINGYEDGRKGERAQDHLQRNSYNAGYDCGHEDGVYNEYPDYTRDDLNDLDGFRKLEEDRLSFFAN